MKTNRDDSWSGYGTCKICGSEARNCSSCKPDADYEYFCPNESCVNNVGTHFGDMEDPPDWIEFNDKWKQET